MIDLEKQGQAVQNPWFSVNQIVVLSIEHSHYDSIFTLVVIHKLRYKLPKCISMNKRFTYYITILFCSCITVSLTQSGSGMVSLLLVFLQLNQFELEDCLY